MCVCVWGGGGGRGGRKREERKFSKLAKCMAVSAHSGVVIYTSIFDLPSTSPITKNLQRIELGYS